MVSTERGAILRRGTVTTKLTGIGTFANSTGLPPVSKTTSALTESVGVLDGHDSPSGFTGLRQNGFSLAGGGAVVIANISPTLIPGGNDSISRPSPLNAIENTSIPGETLPTPGKYFKMVGYYSTGAVYESFISSGNPTPATVVNPNTGHTLTGTYVAAFWTQ